MVVVPIATMILLIHPIANPKKALHNNWKKGLHFLIKNTNHRSTSLIFKHIQTRIQILNHLKKCMMKP